MTQPEFLVRVNREIRQTESPRVTRIEKRRVDRVTNLPGIGSVGFTTGTGKYETNRLRLAAPNSTSAAGVKSGSNYSELVERTAVGVKKVVRRIRPQDAEQIDVIDADIARLQAEIAKKRELRVEVVRGAWARAHVVRLQEVEAMLDGGH